MGFPNYIDGDFYNVVFTGGDWVLPLTNLKSPRLSLPARAASAGNSDTWFDVDLGGLRNITLGAIPSSSSTLDGQYRKRISDTPAFSNDTTVGANASSGASSISLEAPSSGDITVTSGDFFTIGGYLYKSDTTVTISASSSDTISLASASGNDIHNSTLQDDITDGDNVTCNTGDYSSALYDSGTVDIFQIIYPFGSLPWEHPSYWTGKITEEERINNAFPIVDILIDSPVIGRYVRYEFFDSGNTSDFEISRLFLTPGWQPSINPIYGASIRYQSDTNYDKTDGGEKVFDVKQGYRVFPFTIDNLPKNEALTQALEAQKKLGKDKQLFFIFDPEDDVNISRLSFTATVEELDPIIYSYYDHMSFSAVLEEVVGGILT